MAKQSHDIGYRKRQFQELQQRVKLNSPESLARSLVKRGIRSKTILGGR